jgi:hypothetical protein
MRPQARILSCFALDKTCSYQLTGKDSDNDTLLMLSSYYVL